LTAIALIGCRQTLRGRSDPIGVFINWLGVRWMALGDPQ